MDNGLIILVAVLNEITQWGCIFLIWISYQTYVDRTKKDEEGS
jgi:hypothetical protein